MATPAHNEATIILRYATVAAIKRRALDPAPVPDDPKRPKRRPRPLFIIQARPDFAGLPVPSRAR
jgi:hypothetical protein